MRWRKERTMPWWWEDPPTPRETAWKLGRIMMGILGGALACVALGVLMGLLRACML